MKKGGELERVMNAMMDTVDIDVQEILKFMRSFPDEPEARGVECIPPEYREWLRVDTQGDVFRSEKEMLAFMQFIGSLALKFAKDNPDDFDFELLVSEIDDSMEAEGWS